MFDYNPLVVVRFAEVFPGLKRSYGEYLLDPGVNEEEGVKVKGRATTRSGALSNDLYEHHLRGNIGLGVVPIRDDSKCFWGAIDIDDYSMSQDNALDALLAALGPMPVIPCRTKSGGLHIYLFTSEPVPAKLMRDKLSELAEALGTLVQNPDGRDVEIFPKQNVVSEIAIGNWINLPYFGADNTVRYAYDAAGKRMDLEDFIDLAMETRLSRKALQDVTFSSADGDMHDILYGLPPCLQTLATERGFISGVQHNAMVAVITAMKMKYPEAWKTRVREFNDSFFDPKMEEQHLEQMLTSMEKKDYAYRCTDVPIQGVCNRALCVKRQYGIERQNPSLDIYKDVTLVRVLSEPVMWVAQFPSGHTLLFQDSRDLLNFNEFQATAFDAKLAIPEVKPPNHRRAMMLLLEQARDETPPYEVTLKGRLHKLLSQFIRINSSDVAERLNEGMAYVDGDWTYFKLKDLLNYARDERSTIFKTQPALVRALNQYGFAEQTASGQRPEGIETRIWRTQTTLWQNCERDPDETAT